MRGNLSREPTRRSWPRLRHLRDALRPRRSRRASRHLAGRRRPRQPGRVLDGVRELATPATVCAVGSAVVRRLKCSSRTARPRSDQCPGCYTPLKISTGAAFTMPTKIPANRAARSVRRRPSSASPWITRSLRSATSLAHSARVFARTGAVCGSRPVRVSPPAAVPSHSPSNLITATCVRKDTRIWLPSRSRGRGRRFVLRFRAAGPGCDLSEEAAVAISYASPHSSFPRPTWPVIQDARPAAMSAPARPTLCAAVPA